MTTAPNEIGLRVIDGDVDEDNSDEDHSTTRGQAAAIDQLRANLELELAGVVEQEAETARKLETRQTRRAVLEEQLHGAREDAARLMLEEATLTRDEMLASAKLEAEAVLDEGKVRLKALEQDAIARAIELDTQHRELTQRLQAMQDLYDDLQTRLRVIAETSIEDLAASHSALQGVDVLETPTTDVRLTGSWDASPGGDEQPSGAVAPTWTARQLAMQQLGTSEPAATGTSPTPPETGLPAGDAHLHGAGDHPTEAQ